MKAFIRKIADRLIPETEEVSPYTRDHLKGKGFQIGEFTYGCPSVLHWGENSTLKIGKFCSIANDVTIFLGGNHRTDWVTTYPFNILNTHFPNARSICGHPASKGNVTIGNDVWIAKSVTIMSGITIGDGAVIATGSIVTKTVAPYEIVAGNPARHIKYRFSEETIKNLLQLKWWDWNIETINEKINGLCNCDVDNFVRGALADSQTNDSYYSNGSKNV